MQTQSLVKGRQQKPPKTNMVEGEGDDIIVAIVVSKVNMVDGSKDWVIDSGTTRHICSNKNSLFDYTAVREGEKVIYLGDS